MLAQAEMDLERYQAAWARNAIPKQTLDDQEKIVAQYEGTVKTDQGTVDFDQVQLGFYHITAPITGRVGLRLVDPGNLVTANSTTPLAVITQIAADHRGLHHSRRQPERGAGADPQRPPAAGGGLTAPSKPGGQRQADSTRQPDRHHHRHGQAAGASSITRTTRCSPTSS